MNENILIRKLEVTNCTPDLLSHFNRYQEVKRCFRKEENQWVLKDNPYIEQWDYPKKSKISNVLLSCIQQGGVVLCAYDNDKLIGFSSISNNFFGINNNYINLEMLHVSYESRGKGVGKILFREICSAAKILGASKLYISSHSSEESQAFYRSVGCIDTVEINEKLATEEPYDCQMEYNLL